MYREYRQPYVSPDTPNGATVKHAVMNLGQLGRYINSLDDEQTKYRQVFEMTTRLEKFAVAENLKYRHNTPRYTMEQDVKACGEYLRRMMTERLADSGLLIPDSVQIEAQEELNFDTMDEYYEIRVICRANALMPTSTGEKEPRRHYCEHCGSTAFEDQFHSGTCENCGAPFKRGTFHGSGV